MGGCRGLGVCGWECVMGCRACRISCDVLDSFHFCDISTQFLIRDLRSYLDHWFVFSNAI